MLKKEAIKQAIDAIAARDRDIGYSLNELFGTGRIDIVSDREQPPRDGVHFFYFDHRRVPVKKTTFFSEGSAAIEQKLLIAYGEMAQRQALATSNTPVDFSRAAQSISEAGLTCLLWYEIDLAHDRMVHSTGGEKNKHIAAPPQRDSVCELLKKLRHQWPSEYFPKDDSQVQVLYEGAVDSDTPAFFVRFPYTFDTLIQIADLDLSFFSVRFVLSCLYNGTSPYLFACIIDDQIAGLVYLRCKQTFLNRSLEIKYIASTKDARPQWSDNHVLHRGVGTFLVAGVWLLWKNTMPAIREIVLDAERQALRFYEEIGFTDKRPYVYALKRPAGQLLNALVVMVDRSQAIQPDVIREFPGIIRARIRHLTGRTRNTRRRDQALAFIKLCLLSRSQPQLARTAAALLLRHKNHIAEAEGLLQMATSHGRIRLIDSVPWTAHPLFIFKSNELRSHLQGLFHLESGKRLKAIDTVLMDASLAGKWTDVNGRSAITKELAWVHTAEHISKIAATAGKQMVSIDLDTQTTKESYAVACLAVGGIFNLLDAVMAVPGGRGFAAVRPPGHHAEPDKAMGFCLFNNTALGACYLKHIKGVKKIMVVDIDAHHGNGTQKTFFNTNEVLYISMHQFPCYPGSGNFAEIGHGKGEGYSVNVPLDKGMGDREFVQVMDRLVHPLACAYEPEVILVSCGFDLYQNDLLAELKGTPEGYAMMTRLLCDIADKVCGGRIAFLMEGGYNLQGIRDCGLKVIQELCGIPTFEPSRFDKFISRSQTNFPALRKTIAIHNKYWPVLFR